MYQQQHQRGLFPTEVSASGGDDMDVKKFNGTSWETTPSYVYKTATDTLSLPATIYADGTAATIGLKGNTVQNGTPTPSNPVDVVGVGERTGNFLAANSTSATVNTVTISNDNGKITVTGRASSEISSTNSAWKNAFTFRLKAGTYYFAGSASGGVSSYLRNANDDTRISMPNDSFVLSNDTDVYVGFYVYNNNDKTFNVMLNLGNTALPFEPYGIKIPISSANTTTNIYLGEVQTTRAIYKKVLTGEESGYSDWKKSNTYQGSFYAKVLNNMGTPKEVICSHAEYTPTISASSYVYGKCAVDGSNPDRNLNVFIGEASWTVSDFKAYLQQQYANGTPVTIWYVLATETTGIVNEPLQKIGSYADSISGISIPTTDGANALSIGTTVQPSEVTAAYHGWHTGAVHERESGQWD